MALRRRTKNLFRFLVVPLCIAGLLAGSYFYFPFGKSSAPQQANAAWYSGSWSNRIKLTVNASKVAAPATTTVYLTSGTTWSVPSNWSSSNNSIEVIGGGGGGSRGGGGGGAYSKAANVTLTPGGSITYQVGTGGAGVDPGSAAGAGSDTYFCNSTSNCSSISGSAVVAGAKGGGAASTVTAGSGGASGSGIGSVKNSGGTGGNGVDWGGGGGGGAAGPNGVGANGGLAAQTVGGGGGGANGGAAGQAGGSGANGGANRLGSGAGAYASGAGSNGGGGGGGGQTGGAGGAGTEWDATHGSGGGGGGTGDTNQSNNIGGVGGLYGAGGGGTEDSSGSGRVGGNGAQGLIVIQYASPPTQSNFPVYVNLADLPATVWSTMRSDCGDIRVTTSDGSTEIPRELVVCNNGTKTGELWFKAPSVSSAVNTDFYIYYGNSGASDYSTSATYGAQNVWSGNGYVGVWHLKDGTTLSVTDSTANANNGTNNSATAATGQVDGAASFSGSTQYVSIGTGLTTLNGTNSFTISAWAKSSGSNTSTYPLIVGAKNAQAGIGFYSNTTRFYMNFHYASGYRDMDTGFTPTTGTWYYVAGTYNGAAETFYVNGSQQSTAAYTDTITDSTSGAGIIGGNLNNSAYVNGAVDEARISTTTRSATWIQTEYNNQSSPSTFYSMGDSVSGKIYLTTVGSGTWTVPIDWSNASNTVEVIGGGGAGGNALQNSYAGPAGGAGAYSKSVNLTLSGTITYQVGVAGLHGTGNGAAGGNGGDTWFNSASFPSSGQAVGAKGGIGGNQLGGSVGGTGGAAASGYATGSGNLKYSGGAGAGSGGGGGGAGGPNGNGAAGASGGSSSPWGGGGGGGGGGGSAGAQGVPQSTGNGGNNSLGAGGGAGSSTGSPGSNGGGGGGSSGTTSNGANGGNGVEFGNGAGSGGGGGGGGSNLANGGNGGLYGGGGAGDGGINGSLGGDGAQGIIVISYTPAFNLSAPTSTSFALPPAGTGTSTISMTATSTDQGADIEDQNGPVLQYFFTYAACGTANDGTGGANSSAWATSTTYINTGLQANKCYGYKVQARDGLLNYGATTTASTTYTAAAVPGTPVLTPSVTTATIANNANGNPSSNPTTNFAAQIVATSPNDPTWQGKYIDSSGNPQAGKQWLSDAQLDSAVIQNLTPGVSYTVQVMARNESLQETASSTSAVLNIPLGAPGTPTFSNIASESLTVNWSATGGATSYKLERCAGGGCTASQIAAGITGTSYDDSGLTGNTSYYYRVRASNLIGDGPYSATSSPQLTYPAKVSAPTYTNISTTSLTVNWTTPTGGAASYKLERCQGDQCTNFAELIAGTVALFYNDSGLTSNVNYRYRVRATNATGDGPYSLITNTLLYNAPPGSIRLKGNIRIR